MTELTPAQLADREAHREALARLMIETPIANEPIIERKPTKPPRLILIGSSTRSLTAYEKTKRWRKNNPEKFKAILRKYRKKSAKYKAKMRRWRLRNRDKTRATQRRCYWRKKAMLAKQSLPIDLIVSPSINGLIDSSDIIKQDNRDSNQQNG